MTTFTEGERNGKPSRLTTGLLAVSMLFVLGGCQVVENMVNDPLPRFLQSGSYRDRKESEYRNSRDRKESERGQWAGTAVVNRIVNPDGSIVFILDAVRIGKSINTNYSDKFLDSAKYNKSWTHNGKYGFIITYIPK